MLNVLNVGGNEKGSFFLYTQVFFSIRFQHDNTFQCGADVNYSLVLKHLTLTLKCL